MNRQAEGFIVREDARPAAGAEHPHESAHLHVAGEALYVDDIPEIAGTLQERPADAGTDTPRRKQLCPCGSGRKYKKCCLNE